MEIEDSLWQVSVEGTRITVAWKGTLPRPEAVKFNRTLAEKIAAIGEKFELIADLQRVPTHNHDSLDNIQLFIERLKVTAIQKLTVIAINETAKFKLNRVIKSSHFTREFEVILPPSNSSEEN